MNRINLNKFKILIYSIKVLAILLLKNENNINFFYNKIYNREKKNPKFYLSNKNFD
jgi:hypothetical protein